MLVLLSINISYYVEPYSSLARGSAVQEHVDLINQASSIRSMLLAEIQPKKNFITMIKVNKSRDAP